MSGILRAARYSRAVLRGAIAAALTPLIGGGAMVDEDAFEPYVAFLAANGVDGLLALGTTGEGMLLSPSERERVAELQDALSSQTELLSEFTRMHGSTSDKLEEARAFTEGAMERLSKLDAGAKRAADHLVRIEH